MASPAMDEPGGTGSAYAVRHSQLRKARSLGCWLAYLSAADNPVAVGIILPFKAGHGLLPAAATVRDVVRVQLMPAAGVYQLDEAATCHLRRNTRYRKRNADQSQPQV